MNALRDVLIRNIDEFQAIVKSARPTATDVNTAEYEEQRKMYGELLRVAIGLVEAMKKSTNEVLMQYRLFIEDLWEAICADKDPAPITAAFQHKIEAFMKEKWDPIFSRADKMMNDIKKTHKA